MISTNKLQPITENSCLVNIMHEILVDRWNKRIPSIAICPTQKLERTEGYDVALPGFEKTLALQFKAYFRRNYRALDYFKIYASQHNTLLTYPLNCAFYVFPDYKTHSQMYKDRQLELSGQYYKILNNTWFVEVHAIPSATKKILRSSLTTKQIPSFSWSRLSGMIKSCEVGFRIKSIRGRYTLLDPEERIVEKVEIPSGRFSLFYTTTNALRPQEKTLETVQFT